MELIVICPHCEAFVEIAEINCAIFRHGVYKSTMQQLPPHASKEECDRAVEQNAIWGCGRPFRIVDNKAVICEYI